jgi:hypothetical protein
MASIDLSPDLRLQEALRAIRYFIDDRIQETKRAGSA